MPLTRIAHPDGSVTQLVYDANGKKVAEDVEDDDYPVVSISPNGNAVYTLVVQMIKCSADPCRYAVQQFAK